MLSGHGGVDYVRDLALHGFRRLLGHHFVDFVRPHHLYRGGGAASQADESDLYGRGFTIGQWLEDDPRVRRDDIRERLAARDFDVVVFGSVLRGMPLWDDVKHAGYFGAMWDAPRRIIPSQNTTPYATPPDQGRVIFLDGEDESRWVDEVDLNLTQSGTGLLNMTAFPSRRWYSQELRHHGHYFRREIPPGCPGGERGEE